jgi:2-iminobutanoate/2-iminopropanoate deaminase
MSAFSRMRFVGLGCAALFVALTGCSGFSGVTTAGGRPLIYKQGPGDAPSSISEKAGVVVKREAPPAPAGTTTTSSTASPAPAAAPMAAREAAPVAAAPAPERAAAQSTVVAQAAPRAPAEASSAAIAASSDLFNRYTQATRYGDLLFVSGQIAIDQASGAFDASQSIEAQTRRTLENIRLILEANRLTMANVVYATVYLSNIGRFAGMDKVYHGFFKGTPPARAVVEVGHLPRGALVEIAVIAGR